MEMIWLYDLCAVPGMGILPVMFVDMSGKTPNPQKVAGNLL